MPPSSARSSSSSWARAGGADIIDLDRYMRGAVRSSRKVDSERLVVDAGGITASGKNSAGGKINGGGKISAGGKIHTGGKPKLVVGRQASRSAVTSSSLSTGSAPRGKRYSHDSGLSDGSYGRRRHRSHRRVESSMRVSREPVRAGSTTNSMRNFRIACERALREQQEQIARVAQLCERLTCVRGSSGGGAGAGGGGGGAASEASATADSSELSSSSHSRSTSQPRRRDRPRTDECKTYKIIMSKLDELNRLFAARGRSPPGLGPIGACTMGTEGTCKAGTCKAATCKVGTLGTACRQQSDSASQSVSVRDKTVATEPVQPSPAPTETKGDTTPPTPPASHLVERAVGGSKSTYVIEVPRATTVAHTHCTYTTQHSRACPKGRACRAIHESSERARLAAMRARLSPAPPAPPSITRASALVRTRTGRLNVATDRTALWSTVQAGPHLKTIPPKSGLRTAAERLDSLLQCEASSSLTAYSSVHTGRSRFDLDDPVQLYAQAKRLQAMHATARRVLSAGGTCPGSVSVALSTMRCDQHSYHSRSARPVSLCTMCRGYWRALRNCVAQQISRPGAV